MIINPLNSSPSFSSIFLSTIEDSKVFLHSSVIILMQSQNLVYLDFSLLLYSLVIKIAILVNKVLLEIIIPASRINQTHC